MSQIRLLTLLASALLLTACATPATRIQDHPDVYSRATPQQQAMISKGQIALGFPPDFVRLALGEPDRITQHIDKSGTETIWHYVELKYDDGAFAYGGYPYYPTYPFFFSPYYGSPFGPFGFGPTFVRSSSTEQDRLRVIFKDQQVDSIEQVLKG